MWSFGSTLSGSQNLPSLLYSLSSAHFSAAYYSFPWRDSFWMNRYSLPPSYTVSGIEHKLKPTKHETVLLNAGSIFTKTNPSFSTVCLSVSCKITTANLRTHTSPAHAGPGGSIEGTRLCLWGGQHKLLPEGYRLPSCPLFLSEDGFLRTLVQGDPARRSQTRDTL